MIQKGHRMDILENREQWLAEFQNGWLAHYQQTGQFDWKLYKRPKNTLPVAGHGIDLTRSRLMLISSAGAYLHQQQEPFDAPNPYGDFSIRVIPTAVSFDRLDFAHDHYDQKAVRQDAQVLVPLRHLADLVADGVIGELSRSWISFMGYLPDATRLVDETIPAILDAARAERIDAALLVPS